MAQLLIHPADMATAVAVSRRIPEFIDPPGLAEYKRRLLQMPHLILVAYSDDKPVGFNVGYERDGEFYAWLGGVQPSYRRRNIALKLAQTQEDWARQQRYKTVTFKTRNAHTNMLLFALRRELHIVGFKEKGDILTNRILLRKVL